MDCFVGLGFGIYCAVFFLKGRKGERRVGEGKADDVVEGCGLIDANSVQSGD